MRDGAGAKYVSTTQRTIYKIVVEHTSRKALLVLTSALFRTEGLILVVSSKIRSSKIAIAETSGVQEGSEVNPALYLRTTE